MFEVLFRHIRCAYIVRRIDSQDAVDSLEAASKIYYVIYAKPLNPHWEAG